MPETSRQSAMTRGMTVLFAIAGGSAVANLYWAQPLLADIAANYGVSPAAAGSLVMVTQLGYAAGVLLLVPLGDRLNRARLIPAVFLLSSVALLASALAPHMIVLLAVFAAVGLTSVSGQVLVPLAGDLARDDERGRIIGTIASGILIGILLSRTISGLLADVLGWRSVYFIASGVAALLATVMAMRLPSDRPRSTMSYVSLLGSVLDVVRSHRAVQITLGIAAPIFCVFSMFWTSITFLLSAPPFSYSVTQIGLVGLMGLAGALAARNAGRLHDRGQSTPATGAAILLSLASIAIAAIGMHSIFAILLAVFVIDIAIQSINVLNQTRLMSIDSQSRSRLNTAFVVSNFLGGAIGSALAGFLWQHGGWLLVLAGEAVAASLALVIWLLGRNVLREAGPDVVRRR